MKKTIICIIVLFIILGAILYISSREKNEKLSTTNVIATQDTNIIEQIKNETEATADTNMYQIQEEYDGRKILQIKPDIQFDTVLSGILKNGEPKETEIQEILKQRPTKNGIWISKQSREEFLNLLKQNNQIGYEIDENGYLVKKDGNNDKLNKAINSPTLYIIDISGTCFSRDEMSGKIVEYPFEEMDPSQIIETYETENSTIILVTNNSKGKISSKEIFEEITMNLQ